MASIATFRSENARAEYCRLYDAALAKSPLPITESDVETSFGRTHVVEAGDPSKPPLVAMHARQFGSTSWLPLLPTLAAQHRVTMIDAIGDMNKSIATKAITATSQIAAWLEETLSALEIDRAAVVGMSIGAWRAAHYAMTFPNRVDRLALIGPVGLVSGQHLQWIIRGAYANYVRPTSASLQSFIESTSTPAGIRRLREDPWRTVIQQYVTGAISFKFPLSAAQPRPCDLHRLASAQIPTLVMVGRSETLHDGPKAAARFRQQLPVARVVLVDDANHLIPVEQPGVVENLLTDFLQPA